MICENCEVTFSAYNKKRRFCSKSCASIYLHHKQPELRYSKRTKRSFNMTNECTNYINGLLLGDGHIQKGNTHATRITQTLAKKYEEWANQIKIDLQSFDIESTISSSTYYDKRTQKIYHRVFLQTLSYIGFTFFRGMWYNNNVKEIPSNIELDIITLRNWFLGDGYYRKSHNTIQLSTDSFSDNSIEILKDKLHLMGFHFNLNKDRRLHLYRKNEVFTFLENINIRIPSCFSYKFCHE